MCATSERGDAEMCSVDECFEYWQETERTARKQHSCCECHAPIPIGRRYAHVSGIFDDEWESYKLHKECMEPWRFVADVVCKSSGGVLLGELKEELSTINELVHDWDGEGNPTGNPLMDIFDEIRTTYTKGWRSQT